jgi:hypothetical protein
VDPQICDARPSFFSTPLSSPEIDPHALEKTQNSPSRSVAEIVKQLIQAIRRSDFTPVMKAKFWARPPATAPRMLAAKAAER